MYAIAVILEVMDKEASLAWIWFLYPTLGFGAFAAGWGRRPWRAGALLALEFLAASGQHAELTDRFVGPAILAEAGRTYFVQSYAAIALGAAAGIGGVAIGIVRRRRRHNETMQQTSGVLRRDGAAPQRTPVQQLRLWSGPPRPAVPRKRRMS